MTYEKKLYLEIQITKIWINALFKDKRGNGEHGW